MCVCVLTSLLSTAITYSERQQWHPIRPGAWVLLLSLLKGSAHLWPPASNREVSTCFLSDMVVQWCVHIMHLYICILHYITSYHCCKYIHTKQSQDSKQIQGEFPPFQNIAPPKDSSWTPCLGIWDAGWPEKPKDRLVNSQLTHFFLSEAHEDLQLFAPSLQNFIKSLEVFHHPSKDLMTTWLVPPKQPLFGLPCDIQITDTPVSISVLLIELVLWISTMSMALNSAACYWDILSTENHCELLPASTIWQRVPQKSPRCSASS